MKIQIFFLIALVSFVSAASIRLDENQINACATDQLRISGILENTKSLDDIFNLRIESDEGLSAFVSPTLDLQGYGFEKFNVYLSPVCLNPGIHEYKVIATSVRGDTANAIGAINIQNCNLMELRVSQDKTQVCNGEAARFDVSVINLGNEEQNFTLSTDLDPSTYTITRSKFPLEPYSQGRATITLNVPATLYAQGMLNFKINSQSTYSCGSNSREVLATIEIKRCDGARVTALNQIEIQAMQNAYWDIFIDNQKTADEYSISSNCPAFAKVSEAKISLGSLERKSIRVLFEPKLENVGEFDCKISLKSQKFQKEYSVSAKIRVVQNYAARIEMTQGIRVCQGEEKSISGKVVNLGDASGYLLSLNSGIGKLQASEVNVQKNSSANFTIKISDALAAGSYDLEISAKSPYASSMGKTIVKVEDCYATALRVDAPSVEICAGESRKVKITNTNKGTKEDSFIVSSIVPEGLSGKFLGVEAFRLKSQEKKEIEFEFLAKDSAKEGNYQISFRSLGVQSEEFADVNVNVLPVGVCHALEVISQEKAKKTGAGIGKSFTVKIKNNGRFRENVELFLKNKPSWAYITPSSVSILPGTTEEALIYFAPPLNEELREFPFALEVRGKYLNRVEEFKVQVIAIEKNTQAKIDFGKLQLPKTLERDAETPLKITVGNLGQEKLTSINVFFSQGIAILEQKPFDLESGETKEIEILAKVEGTDEKIKTRIGIYAKEGFSEKEVEFEATEASMEFMQGEILKTADGFETSIKIKNKGDLNARLIPSSLEGVGFSEKEIVLKSGEEFELGLNITSGNETLVFKDAISGKIYRKRIEVEKESGSITGLFTASLTKVGPLLAAIVGGAIALYLVVSRRKKLLEKIDGKKENIDENEADATDLSNEIVDEEMPDSELGDLQTEQDMGEGKEEETDLVNEEDAQKTKKTDAVLEKSTQKISGKARPSKKSKQKRRK
ncbi:hypothetical protein HY989_03155 [Candidatus Micrarchaeota archaeon]|nr:hypothetical protein [Candidatus Micrarchaeota archaeon]